MLQEVLIIIIIDVYAAMMERSKSAIGLGESQHGEDVSDAGFSQGGLVSETEDSAVLIVNGSHMMGIS